MCKADIDLLVEQIRTILLNKPLSKDERVESEELSVLQDAIFYLADCLQESNDFLHHLQVGELDIKPPSRHNFLAGNLKELHSALQHLTWQANQVANGDYSQSVNFLGDFSTSFNKMIQQLAERESQLKIQSQMLSESAELMKSVMDGLKDWIIVTSRDTGEIIYTNQSAKQFYANPTPEESDCQGRREFLDYIRRCGQEYSESQNSSNRSFEYQCCQTRRSFRIHTYEIQWSEKIAYAHVITDVTSDRAYQEQMEGLAYMDELTGLYNRRFCLEQVNQLLEDGTEFTFCMIDLDRLKYANDSFGHSAGDDYLKAVAEQLRQSSRSTDWICRIGGDEFAAIFPHCKPQIILDKMERMDQILAKESGRFPMSVSYGVVYVGGGEKTSVQELMEQADEKMYILKNMKKAARGSQSGMVVAFVWSKSLETGNAQIDGEHKKLIGAINRLLEACAAGKGDEELSRTVDFLYEYTKTHFSHEEALQVRYDYPDYANHKQFHDTFMKIVEHLADRLKAEGPTVELVTEINKQLAGWLLNHIKTEDAKVAQYIKNQETQKTAQ